MARFQPAQRQIVLKIVYYGAGLCGKTTNLVSLHGFYPDDARGKLVKLDTETERTLFFDYFQLSLEHSPATPSAPKLFTVPGQSFYNATRKAVLQGVDGVVFVADSSPDREEANIHSWENLHENLVALGRVPADVPTVFQWNKRDVKKPIAVSVLQKQFNRANRPAFEAVASTGVGVWDTQAAVLKQVLDDLKARSRPGSAVG